MEVLVQNVDLGGSTFDIKGDEAVHIVSWEPSRPQLRGAILLVTLYSEGIDAPEGVQVALEASGIYASDADNPEWNSLWSSETVAGAGASSDVPSPFNTTSLLDSPSTVAIAFLDWKESVTATELEAMFSLSATKWFVVHAPLSVLPWRVSLISSALEGEGHDIDAVIHPIV